LCCDDNKNGAFHKPDINFLHTHTHTHTRARARARARARIAYLVFIDPII